MSNIMTRSSHRISLICIIYILGVSSIFADELSLTQLESSWDAILKNSVISSEKHDISTALVNYEKIKKDKRFTQLKEDLKTVDIKKLRKKNEKVAFWINVYNIGAINLIVTHSPESSIKDIGGYFNSVWSQEAIKVGKHMYTLNDIEHHILRKLKEPRIHAAIVCASLSCPDLKPSAYHHKTLSKELSKQLSLFIKNETKGIKFDEEAKVVTLSKIFKWFDDDFEIIGGIEYVIGKELKKKSLQKYSISYFIYDWSLNEYKQVAD